MTQLVKRHQSVSSFSVL